MKVKQKTHKGLDKRVRVTPSGKVKRKASFCGHLMSHKSGKRCRRVRKMILMGKSDTARTIAAMNK